MNSLRCGGKVPLSPPFPTTPSMLQISKSFLALLACGCLFPMLNLHAAGVAVINEFHAKPEDLHELEEFVELHNPGDEDLDLSGWSLTDAVSFTMPPGTTLAADGYLVVAMDPVALQARFGVSALGPWSGKLNSSGEKIILKDAGGTQIDRVDYKFGFPWPSRIDGEGASAELINPGLENDDGSSWRSSGTAASGEMPETYIEQGDGGWNYFKSTSEPASTWRDLGFDDSAWATDVAPFGYGDSGIQTFFNDMPSPPNPGYAGAYFRKSFAIAPGAVPAALHLRLNVDDGCVVWINGVEVKRRNVPAGSLSHTDLATLNVEQAWEDITIPDAENLLVVGTNVVAVHVVNSRLNSGDFFFDMALETQTDAPHSELPTPGARNTVYLSLNQTPPQISNVEHAPEKPVSGQPVTVTAKLADPEGMGAVSLEYQLVDPGSYIRVSDAAYQTSWVSVVMSDDGSGGDAVAGDGTYTAMLPGSLQTHRRLTRYRIRFADAMGNSTVAPFADDAAANFAWFTYDGTPAWKGALRPATTVPGNSTPLATYSPATLTSVPVYTLIASNADVMNSQYNGNYNKVRFRGTFISDGVVFDNIEFRNRGQGSTYNTGKNKWRFHFNPGRDFQAYDNDGEPYAETWGSFSANANAGPWAPLHKGSLGIEEASSLKLYQMAGVPSPAVHYYNFRVIRGAEESPAAGVMVNDPISPSGSQVDGQYAGDFWGTYLAVERLKGGFLDSRGLPDGNIYKIEGNQGDPEHLVAGQSGDSSDWSAFRDASNQSQTESWWRANMDMDAYYTFHAINRLVGNVDLRQGENHFFYHRVTSDNRWVPIPWDLDMMYVAKTHQGTSINGSFYPGVIDQHRSILENPNLAREYRNRAREIIDLVGSDASPHGGQIGQLFDQLDRIISPAGAADTLVNADAAIWNIHPRARGNWNSSTGLGNPSGQDNHRGNFFRAVWSDNRIGGSWTRQLGGSGFSGVPTHKDLVDYFVGYATNTFPSGESWFFNNGDQRGYGYQTLVSESADAAVPATPVLTYTGPAGFPSDRLSFSASAYNGSNGYGMTQWRVAEIAAPGLAGFDGKWNYEVTGTWATTGAGTAMEVPASALGLGKTYRARVRFVDAAGVASHWSLPVEFVVGNESARIAHYWDFNGASLESALVPVAGTGGAVTNTAGPTTEFTTGTGQDFSGANARYGSAAAEHLRVNNPIGASLDISLPTTGFERVALSVETRRSGSGAGTQTWSYTLDGMSYVVLGDVVVESAAPPVIGWDFKAISGADNNPHFAVRVTFNEGLGGATGNNRFDNLVLTGNPLPGGYAAWVDVTFPTDSHLDLQLTGMTADSDGDGRSNFEEFALATSPVTHDTPDLRFVWSTDGGTDKPGIAFDRPAGVIGVKYELQTSVSMAADEWTTVDETPVSSIIDGNVEHCIFRDPTGDPGVTKCFLRLRISPTP